MVHPKFIGVGCVAAQRLAFEVLKFSILSRASIQNLRIVPLYEVGINIPTPRDESKRQKTPFSFQRFLIPEACGYQGRAMYLDSDMIVLADIAPLFESEFGDANVLGVPNEFSVILLDCARLDWNIRELVAALDSSELSYDGLVHGRAVSRIEYSLPKSWNWLDNVGGRPPQGTSLVHYTVTTTQPWISSGHIAGDIWLGELFKAIDEEVISLDFVQQQVDAGFVRPSLMYQVEHRVTTKEDLPRSVRDADEPFAGYCRQMNYRMVEGFCANQLSS
jgi:hypothetical protein